MKRPPDHPSRTVVLIVGPPGSGKTTLAHTLGLTVYDLDDEEWEREQDWEQAEAGFRWAIKAIGLDPNARACVIRTAANPMVERITATQCRATQTITLDTDQATCIERVVERGRGDVEATVAAVREWFAIRG